MFSSAPNIAKIRPAVRYKLPDMTESAEFTSFLLEVAATPSPMRKALVEACDAFLEGMGPSFTELRHYLNEINTDSDEGNDFSEAWDMSGEPGTVSGVVHFLTSELPEGRKAFTEILRMAQGKHLQFVATNQGTDDEVARLTDKDRLFLRDAELTGDFSEETVKKALDLVPACSLAVLRQAMGDWSNSDERNLSVPDDPGEDRVVNGWLVHNSDNAADIYREGFLIGNPIGYLAYGKRGEAFDDRYGFAYRLQDAPAPGERSMFPGLKYTQTTSGASIVFQGTGNVIDHYGDREKQVIFDIREPEGCFLVKYIGEPETLADFNGPNWAVYGKNPDRPLVSGRYYRDCLGWIEANGYQYRNQMKMWNQDTAFGECVEGIENAALVEALGTGYSALFEAKVCRDLRPVYNTIMATGDWELLDPGAHDTKVRLKVTPELMEYVRTHFDPNQNRPLTNSVLFTGTELSDKAHGVQNIVNNVKQAYALAAQCEYEMNGNDPGKVTWVRKAQPFMDRYGHGKPVWTPPEDTGMPMAADVSEPYDTKVTTDGQTYECPWLKYRNKKKGIVSSVGDSMDPIVEGKLGRILGGAALGLGLMAGGANATKPDPMACLASPGYAKNHATFCNTLKPDPKAAAKIRAQKKAAKAKPGKATTVSIDKSTLKHVYGSKAYNERVDQLIREMARDNPGMDHDKIVRNAENRAITEIATGKLK